MLTFFAIPKAFQGHFAIIQANAIRSWQKLGKDIEIILCGDDKGVKEFAAHLKLKHIPKIKRNQYGTPLLNDCFAKAAQKAKFNLLCFLNADIILTGDFLPAVSRVSFSRFLITGQRYNLKLKTRLKFESNWEQKLKKRLRSKSHDRQGAVDYFVFPRLLKLNPPPFAVGRTAWDNWLIYKTRLLKAPVIDASSQITAIHQKHDYSHASSPESIWKGPERKQNWLLAGDKRKFFNLRDATWEFKNGKLKPISWSFGRIVRSIEKFPVLYPTVGFIAEPLIFLFRVVRFLKFRIAN